MAIGRLARWFKKDVEVYAISKDRVDYGAQPVETLVASFKGWVRPLSTNERVASDKMTAISTHRLYCDASVHGSFDEGDILVVDATRFDITAVIEPMELDSHLQIDLKMAS